MFLRKTPAFERVITLTYDALISFGIMTAVPLMIFIPYVQAFNISNELFKNGDFLYNPVAITKLVLENRLIFASGLFDFGTKLIPHLSIVLSLVTMSELLGRSDVKVIPGAGADSIQSVAVKPMKGGRADILKPRFVTKPVANPPNSSNWASFRALHKWRHEIAIALFILWGAIILLLHGLAAVRAASYEVVGCRAVTRLWFSNGKEPCSSLVFDCQARNVVTPDETSFNKVDSVALSTLAIVHCPELEMPTDLQAFSNLIMLHIYNSTIVRWDVDSSISATAHTHMLSVLVGKTDMAEFPEGLLQPLPSTLLSIQFSETNLTRIPDDLHVRWHALVVIVFENGILADIPYQMFFMPVYMLSFIGNQIETLPTLAMMPPSMVIPDLKLKNNPLQELPAQLMDPTSLIMSLNVQNTSVATMPEWVKTQTLVVWAYDTPFCATPITDPELVYKVMWYPRPVAQEAFFPMYLFEELYPFGEVV